MRVGLLSDTHLPSLVRTLDELGPEIGEFLASVDRILHAGDVVAPSVIDWCEQFAPTIVARGNNDVFDDPRMQKLQLLEIEGWRIGVVHEIRPSSRPVDLLIDAHLDGERVDVLVSGDTHVEHLEHRDGVVLINPGSPTLPHQKECRLGTVGLLELNFAELRAEIVVLGHTEGSPNPGTSRQLSLSR